MISRIRVQSPRELFVRDLPPLAGSLAVAELFFKFGSFTAEGLAFLALWFLLDLAYTKVRRGFTAPVTREATS